MSQLGLSHFNPRTREGLRRQEHACRRRGRPISIHAPVKGATGAEVGSTFPHAISIHAPVKGATVVYGWISHLGMNFNPRTREGCDADSMVSTLNIGKFQSTHP